MNNGKLRVLLVDLGMNPGGASAHRIGGGQIARRRFLSDPDLFEVTLLTSEEDLAALWRGAAGIILEPALRTYRPTRADIAGRRVDWRRLIHEGCRASRVLAPYLFRDSHDVIFLNDNKSRMLYLLTRLRPGRRNMSARTVLQVDGEWTLGVFDFLMKNLYLMFFDGLICSTRAARKQLGALRHLFPGKLLTAYPGVDPPAEPPGRLHPGETGRAAGKIVLGCVGTLKTEVKGQDLIVRAVERLVRKHGRPPLEVRFFGEGPDREKLEADIAGRGLGDYFRFEGFVADQERIYAAVDACLLASRTEVAPLVVMESLMRDIPVIAADLNGCREILSPFDDTLFFRKGDAVDLARVLEKALAPGVLAAVRLKLKRSDKRLISRAYQAGRVYAFLRGAPRTKTVSD
jgi:glycosyltransferase involved in cell wall biosynthesis